MNDYTWSAHIPLIGGGALACEQIFNKPPNRVYSLPGFWANDSLYMNWLNNTNSNNVEYVTLDPTDREFKEKINVVICCPPCAALSGLNRGGSEEVRGANCSKNDFIYIVSEQSIKCFDADVIIIENAPALSTKKGRPVADKIYKIAKENNYSLTLYATSTSFHGIPQNRMRTFAILWKSKTAPLMEYIRKDHLSFKEYLETSDGNLNDIEINSKIKNDPYAAFIEFKTKRSAREICLETNTYTTFDWVKKYKLLNDANKWFHETNNVAGIKTSEHAIKKLSAGLGVWDSSQHHFDGTINAVVGRNMTCAVHPTENRSLTIREAMHLMALPSNFELIGGLSHINKICQNMPVCTAADMVRHAVLFLDKKLDLTDSNYIKQNNHNKTLEVYDVLDQTTLEEFIQ